MHYRRLIYVGFVGVSIGLLTAFCSAVHVVSDRESYQEGEHLRRVKELNGRINSGVLHLPGNSNVADLLEPSFRDQVVEGIRKDVAERDSLGMYFEKELIRENQEDVAHKEHIRWRGYSYLGGTALAFASLIPLCRGLNRRNREKRENERAKKEEAKKLEGEGTDMT